MRLTQSVAARDSETFADVLAAEVREQVEGLNLGVWEAREVAVDVLSVAREGDSIRADLLVSYEPPDGPACLANGPGGVRVVRRTVRINPATGDAEVTDTDDEE